MRILVKNQDFDTDKDAIFFMFNDDSEFSSFISKLVETPIRTSGIRVLTLVPENLELTPLQKAFLDVIEGMDGATGKDHDSIIDNTVAGLEDILKKY